MTPRHAPASPAWRHLMATLPRPGEPVRGRPRSPGILRAVALDVRRIGPAEARVTGGKAPHRVTWDRGSTLDGGALRCDCLAFSYRPHLDCKHILAVRLRRGERSAWAALREEVAA